jgi:homoserine dehydrogenase
MITNTQHIGIGLLGLGTVGTGVVKLLAQHPVCRLDAVAVRHLDKARRVDLPEGCTISTDPLTVVQHPDVQLVVEVMGGLAPAYDLVTMALRQQKHVVTANKELIAKHGPELFALANAQGVRLLFEGAVAGGIPIIMPMVLSLRANRILEIAGIVNGTTNYILTQMTRHGRAFGDALAEAQAKGFAEADPTSDVEAFDSAYKISILASIALGQWVDHGHIYREGISQLTPMDIHMAETLGYAIKLIGLARASTQASSQRADVRVHPMLVPLRHPLASIHDEYNAVFVRGDAVGDVMFYGRGAGELPTASAVCADVLAIAEELAVGRNPIPAMALDVSETAHLLPVTETRNRYYVRLSTADMPGVIGNLGKACGEFGVSLASVMQKDVSSEGTATIVLLTHVVKEKALQGALVRIRSQETTHHVGCVLRVL